MDKTCRTCSKDGRNVFACFNHLNGLSGQEGDTPCEYWEERTDSLEQTALDMLHSLDYWGRMNRIPNVSAEFAERLRAHGIEVPE